MSINTHTYIYIYTISVYVYLFECLCVCIICSTRLNIFLLSFDHFLFEFSEGSRAGVKKDRALLGDERFARRGMLFTLTIQHQYLFHLCSVERKILLG